MRKLLTEQLRTIARRLGGLEGLEVELGPRDEMDVIVAGFRDELVMEDRRRLTERAFALHRALKRIEAGEYGICTTCDHPIAPARLAAIPEADLCVGCQERHERDRRTLERLPSRRPTWEEDE